MNKSDIKVGDRISRGTGGAFVFTEVCKSLEEDRYDPRMLYVELDGVIFDVPLALLSAEPK